MPKTRPPYSPEFRRQMVDLVRAGCDPAELAREFEPTARPISHWVAQADRQPIHMLAFGAFGRQWEPSAMPTTTPCAKASSPRSNTNCWSDAGSHPGSRSRWPASASSKVGTTRCGYTPPSATARQWPMKRRWRRSRQSRNHPSPTPLYENGELHTEAVSLGNQIRAGARPNDLAQKLERHSGRGQNAVKPRHSPNAVNAKRRGFELRPIWIKPSPLTPTEAGAGLNVITHPF